jgi:hypothetical protein
MVAATLSVRGRCDRIGLTVPKNKGLSNVCAHTAAETRPSRRR